LVEATEAGPGLEDDVPVPDAVGARERAETPPFRLLDDVELEDAPEPTWEIEGLF